MIDEVLFGPFQEKTVFMSLPKTRVVTDWCTDFGTPFISLLGFELLFYSISKNLLCLCVQKCSNYSSYLVRIFSVKFGLVEDLNLQQKPIAGMLN